MKISRIRALYSFPFRLGADRICYTAWQQVNGLASAGAELLVFSASLGRPVPRGISVSPTLARGKLRLPYRIVGTMRAVAMHDWIVARRVEKLAGQIDIIHTWPLGSRETLRTAARLGIPTVLERPNANTRFAMEVTQRECERLGVVLPPDHEHAYNVKKLRKEEEEYRLATRLLCPSQFVVKTFLDKGYPQGQLARHIYGYDEKVYYPSKEPRDRGRGLTMISVGVCAVRKGLHYALEAWLRSPASKDGTFLIAGGFLPAYQEKLAPMLAHPSVKVLGHRNDVPELLRKSDILVLPSIEEGFGLVITEAMGSGCVPLASEACTEICSHMKTGLMHRIGDVEALTQHITMLHEDRALLENLRAAGLAAAPEVTWTAAGRILLDVYRETIAAHTSGAPQETSYNQEDSLRQSMRNPRVSVVIPTYNRAATVCKGIESVLSQTVADLEVIVVDDGSLDDTGRILSETFGDRIRYYHQRNQGASIARNKGIEEARGEWIAFLDSDDLWEVGKLEWQLKALDHFGSQCGACYTDARFFNHPETRTMFQMVEQEYQHEESMGVNRDVLKRLVRPGGAGMVICLSSLVARADLVRKTGGFDLKLLYSQDSEFMFRLAMLTGFCYVNLPLVQFDRSPAEIRHVGVQSEWNNFEFWLRDSQLRLEGLLRLSQSLPKDIRNVIKERLSTIHRGWTNLYLETGQYKKARKAASRAVQLDLSFNVAAKCLLTWMSPRLALRTVRRRQEAGKESFTV